jgi:hypothetical protein
MVVAPPRLLRQPQEGSEVARRMGGVHHQDLRRPDQFDHRREVPDRIIADAAVERGVDGQRVGPDQQRMPIRPGARDHLEGEVGTGAGMVLGHDRLAERGRDGAGEGAAEDIQAAARRDRDHDPDRALGPGGLGAERQGQRGGAKDKEAAPGQGRAGGGGRVHGSFFFFARI